MYLQENPEPFFALSKELYPGKVKVNFGSTHALFIVPYNSELWRLQQWHSG